MTVRTIEIPALTELDLARFWSKVDKAPGHGPEGTCWMWTGASNSDGYGHLGLGGKMYKAHRLSWFMDHGLISGDLQVLHRCDNRVCVNPAHLWLGTNADNNRDMCKKGRQVTSSGDLNGARMHPECVPRGKCHGRHTKPWRTARGERQGSAKLTAEQVVGIRERYAAGGISYWKLGAEYGVSHSLICAIVRREKWKHI